MTDTTKHDGPYRVVETPHTSWWTVSDGVMGICSCNNKLEIESTVARMNLAYAAGRESVVKERVEKRVEKRPERDPFVVLNDAGSYRAVHRRSFAAFDRIEQLAAHLNAQHRRVEKLVKMIVKADPSYLLDASARTLAREIESARLEAEREGLL